MKKVSIWQITATSLDDGHRIRMGYFLDRQKADTRCAELPPKMEAAVLKFDCLQDEKGNYYAIPDRPLDVSDAKEAARREMLRKRFEGRKPTAPTADFDLMAPPGIDD